MKFSQVSLVGRFSSNWSLRGQRRTERSPCRAGQQATFVLAPVVKYPPEAIAGWRANGARAAKTDTSRNRWGAILLV